MYPFKHLEPGRSLTVIDRIGDLEEEGDVGVGEPIVALPWLPGEEHSTQMREESHLDIGWWWDGVCREIFGSLHLVIYEGVLKDILACKTWTIEVEILVIVKWYKLFQLILITHEV